MVLSSLVPLLATITLLLPMLVRGLVLPDNISLRQRGLVRKAALSLHGTTAPIASSTSSTALFMSSSDRKSRSRPPLEQDQQQMLDEYKQKQDMFDSAYYYPPDPTPVWKANHMPTRITLTRFLSNAVKDHPELRDLESLLLAVQMACKTISTLVNRAGLVYSIRNDLDDELSDTLKKEGGASSETATSTTTDDYADGRFYSMKRLDRISTTVLKNALKFTGNVKLTTPEVVSPVEQPSEHQPGVLIASALDSNYVACLDPLDGSGNADASICTGTVFGVFERDAKKQKSLQEKEDKQRNKQTKNKGRGGDKKKGDARELDDDFVVVSTDEIDTENKKELLDAVLQPAKNMRAAGYCLYSSATVLVFTLKDEGVYGFTLDPQIQEFVLTHNKLTIPQRGTVYSCNEANSEGWTSKGFKEYLRALKKGTGETKTRYAHRYVGSMVGDIHRTLLYGGLFAYPSAPPLKPMGNLQLLYKSAPMAFIVHHAGGKALDENGNDLMDIKPERIHQKSPCFMGSPDDVDELQKYFDKYRPKPEKEDDSKGKRKRRGFGNLRRKDEEDDPSI